MSLVISMHWDSKFNANALDARISRISETLRADRPSVKHGAWRCHGDVTPPRDNRGRAPRLRLVQQAKRCCSTLILLNFQSRFIENVPDDSSIVPGTRQLVLRFAVPVVLTFSHDQ
jgi:hypothetical protein